MINLIKLYIATIRWGLLSSGERQIIKDSTFHKIFTSNYIFKTSLSQNNIATLDK
jgi:hypothetical protein